MKRTIAVFSTLKGIQPVSVSPEYDSMIANMTHTRPVRMLIVGSGGRLGQALVNAFCETCDIIQIDHRDLDIGCSQQIADVLLPIDFNYLIITAALTAVDYCESHRDEAFAVNATGPGVIAQIAASKGAHVTYFSSDMVFDGLKAEAYSESDYPSPVSVYGKSKLEGERRVLGASDCNLVVRISWVFGPGRPAFPEWIIDRACCESCLTLPVDKIGCPTHTKDVANLIGPLLFSPNGPAHGVFHLCNSGTCTWQEWGQYCVDIAQGENLPLKTSHVGGSLLESVTTFVAKRPPNSAMRTDKYVNFTGIQPRHWREAVSEFLSGCESIQSYRKPHTCV